MQQMITWSITDFPNFNAPYTDSFRLNSLHLVVQDWPSSTNIQMSDPQTLLNPINPALATPKDQLGLNILWPAESSTVKPDLNIVFVHGLGGGSAVTWTDPKSGGFWPLWLHNTKGLEKARILTFGYNSNFTNIFRPNNVLNIDSFADQLLFALRAYFWEYKDV